MERYFIRESMCFKWSQNVGVCHQSLFPIDLDDLIPQLRSLNVGCHINRLCVGAVYANDITLLLLLSRDKCVIW